jgi:hypothetical protein
VLPGYVKCLIKDQLCVFLELCVRERGRGTFWGHLLFQIGVCTLRFLKIIVFVYAVLCNLVEKYKIFRIED